MTRINVGNIRHPDASADALQLTSGGDVQVIRALGLGGATYGTSGQVLTSGGASAAPSWGSAGKILQVQSYTHSTRSTEAISANSAGTTKWLTVNITPSSTDSKIIIWYVLKGALDYGYMGTILRRGTTPISVGTSPGQRAATTTFEYTGPDTTVRLNTHTACIVDSPGVTSQLDYNVIVHNSDNGSHTFYSNSTVNNTDQATLRNRVASNIIVAEYLP